MEPRGLRNNNPLNIRNSAEFFQGQSAANLDASFKKFDTIEYGYRAAFVILGTYLSRGINTIEKIVSTWAPPSENHTEKYIQVVCMRSGIDRKKVLTNRNGMDYVKIVAAMAFMENGKEANVEQVKKGMMLQNKIM